MVTPGAETYVSGGVAEAGSYKCRRCGLRIGIDHLAEVPSCPGCGGTRFRRAPLFRAARALSPPTTEGPTLTGPAESPDWLGPTRALLDPEERYLAFEDAGVRVIPLAEGWSRVGRSPTCDIRLEDPTVSRRHALIVRSPEGEVRVLDDRSLNGVSVNGEAVEWATLADGDELAIGRFRLYLVAAGSADSAESAASGTSARPSA